MSKKILAILFVALSFNCTALLAQEGSLAVIHVYKIYQGIVEAETPADLRVEVQLSCNGGDNNVQNGFLEADGSVHFNLENFTEGATNCTVTEVAGHEDFFPVYLSVGEGELPPNEGARWAILPNFGDYPFDDGPQECVFENISSGDYTCRIFNAPHSADFTINKSWDFGNSDDPGGAYPDYLIGLICLGGWQYSDADEPPDDIVNANLFIFPVSFAIWNTDSTDDETYETNVVPFFNVYPDEGGEIDALGSVCIPLEETFDSRVEITSDCGIRTEIDLEDLFEANPENFVAPNTSHECNVLNTIFFEGIPTLNQYGMALMALLMLGLGFVGVRRFA